MPFNVTVGGVSFRCEDGRVVTAIAKPDAASGVIAADDVALSPADRSAPARVAIRLDVVTSGEVVEAVPLEGSSVAVAAPPCEVEADPSARLARPQLPQPVERFRPSARDVIASRGVAARGFALPVAGGDFRYSSEAGVRRACRLTTASRRKEKRTPAAGRATA